MIFEFLTRGCLFYFTIQQQCLFGISWGKSFNHQGWIFSVYLGPFSFTWFLGVDEFYR